MGEGLPKLSLPNSQGKPTMTISSSFKPIGLLVIGHGTRSAQGVAEFLETVRLAARLLPAAQVQACFLELAQPTIAAGIDTLVQRGARRIIVLPLLLFAAGHVKTDIPAEVERAKAVHPEIDFQLAAHLGCHPHLESLSAQRYAEAVAPHDEVAPQDTCWLLVGRGSRDAEALAETRRFAALRQNWTPVGCAQVAYLAMAEPSLEQILPQVASWHFRRVVVQPHLLFHGELLTTLRKAVTSMAAQFPQQQWIMAEHLGPATPVAEVVVERFLQAKLAYHAHLLAKL